MGDASSSVSTRGVVLDPWIVGAVAWSLAVCLVYSFLVPANFNPDDYLRWGSDFLGWWKTAHLLPVMRTPGYPLFLSLNLQTGLGRPGVKIFQSLFLAGTGLMMARLTAAAAGIVAARWAAWLFALYVPLLSYAAVAMTEAVAVTLTVVAVSAVLIAARSDAKRLGWAALAAMSASAATIVRPNSVAYFAIVAVALLLISGTPRRAVAMVCLLAMSVMVVFGPWIGRNLATTGRPQPFGNDGVYPLALGVHLPFDKDIGEKSALRRSFRFFSGTRPDGFTPEKAAQVHPMHELENNLLHHTGEFVWARAVAQFQMWAWPPTPRVQSGRSEAVPYPLIMVMHLLVLVSGAVGLVRLRRTAFARLGLAIVGLTVAVYLVYWTNPRYTLPAMPFLLAGSGVTLAAVSDRLRARARRRARGRGNTFLGGGRLRTAGAEDYLMGGGSRSAGEQPQR